MHGLAYDAVHDEIIVPVALAGAVLVFRGGAQGAEAPIRVLQGPRTGIVRPDTLAVDTVHDELIVDAGGRDGGILIFDRRAQGDASPKRVIRGPKTRMASVYGLGVDPKRNLILAANHVEGRGREGTGVRGILFYNRTDEGDVAPRQVIAGPRTGILWIRQIEVDPEHGKVFVAVKNNIEIYDFEKRILSPWDPDKPGFIGVWNLTDDGDVPPRAVLKGPNSRILWPAGVALNPRDGELYTIDSVSNSLYMFSVPEFFREPVRASQ
jgi:DNA-binding beta-propeller fold protein YncE